jgi:hypothetical protein
VACIAAEDEDPSADHCSGTALSSMDPHQLKFSKMIFEKVFETPVKWLLETLIEVLFEVLIET